MLASLTDTLRGTIGVIRKRQSVIGADTKSHCHTVPVPRSTSQPGNGASQRERLPPTTLCVCPSTSPFSFAIVEPFIFLHCSLFRDSFIVFKWGVLKLLKGLSGPGPLFCVIQRCLLIFLPSFLSLCPCALFTLRGYCYRFF